MVFETTVRVRFRDTDMYGHVNNASFATYMEETRIQFMERELGGFRLPMILASSSYTFVKQTKFPEDRDLRCQMWFRQIGMSSATMQAHVLNPLGDLVCQAQAVIVHFDYQAQKPTRIPMDARAVFEQFLMADELHS